jgi:hypothetical protein
MSTTIPLTLIEGSMALPRLRPFGHLPAPFGRDWALLPPGRSLRAELKALYAALLRTFCVDARAIHALCRWDPARKSPPVNAAAIIHSASFPFETSAGEISPTPQGAAPSASAGQASVRGTAARWGAWSGGTCVLGGAAVLAWLAFGHSTQRQTGSDATPGSTVSANRGTLTANSRATDIAATHRAANNEATVHTLSDVSSAARVATAPAPGSASAGVSPNMAGASRSAEIAPRRTAAIVMPVTVAPARVATNQTPSRRRDKLREKAVILPDVIQRGHSSRSTTIRSPDPRAANDGMPQIVIPAIAQSASPKPSAAGPYSPIAPSPLGTDEYASLTLSAGTHLRNIAPPPRPASSNNTSATGATEWMNHMSQRRVTDVPDQFAK